MATLRGQKQSRKQNTRKRKRVRRVRIGAPDHRLTPAAGLEAIRELDQVLDITGALDAGIGPIKQRNRGLTGGQLVVAMACAQLVGEDFLVGLDRRRADTAGHTVEPVPTPASTTAAGIARRFTPEHLRGIEAGVGQLNTRMVSMVSPLRRASLLKTATIDLDTTDIEVYGRTKDYAEYAYTGALTIREHIGFWAEAGIPVAAEQMGGTADPRTNCVQLLDRSIAGLPDGVQNIQARVDGGYFAETLAAACLRRGVTFAIGAKRTSKIMTAAGQLGRYTWIPAMGMDNTELAVIDYLPGTWPTDANIVCIARRTRIPVEQIPTGRARKRRTIPKHQLALALDGKVDAVYGYSFVLTNLDLGDPAQDVDEHAVKVAEAEYWYRHRTDIEELNRNAKHGTALRHAPSAHHAVNSVWMWAGLLGCAISAWLQELTGIDNGRGRGRYTVARLARELINLPAHITRHGGIIYLRLPPGPNLLTTVLPLLQSLPRPG